MQHLSGKHHEAYSLERLYESNDIDMFRSSVGIKTHLKLVQALQLIKNIDFRGITFQYSMNAWQWDRLVWKASSFLRWNVDHSIQR
jgi:hypothetical protein